MTGIVQSVQVGRVAPLGRKAVPSGFVKRAVSGPVGVSSTGLSGDEQADLSVHGGPEKAIYAYAAGHYHDWQADFPEHSGMLIPGSMGENLTITGLDESDLCVGDVHRAGTALLQVCQPRQPCFKLSVYFGDAKLPRAMVRSGRSGWYYRVLEEGELWAGGELTLIDRPTSFRFDRLVEIVNGAAATPGELAALAHMPELASSLRRSAQIAVGR
jgi:MOSC domain-containing protein YiiM